MLKKETIDLLNNEEKNFQNVFSICVGKSFTIQKRLKDYLGNFSNWDTDVREGILKLDERPFKVEYIGTTSTSDNFWYSAEEESVIPEEYSRLINRTRTYIESLNVYPLLAQSKIVLGGDVNGYNLSMIYVAFAPENVGFYSAQGSTTINMYIKDLPEDVFKPITTYDEIVNMIVQTLKTFTVNHKLMVKALLCENGIMYNEVNNDAKDEIIASIDNGESISIKFDNMGRVKNIIRNFKKEE